MSDVIEISGGFRGVDGRLDESDGCAELLIGNRDESGPERSHGAGAANDHRLAIDANSVSGGWVGITGDIGNASPAATPAMRS